LQIQKNTGIPAVKTTIEKSVNIMAAKTQPQTAPQVLAIPRSIASLISSLNLPKDKLSANLISFARFFSLPMKPEQLNEIRKQAFLPKLPDASLIDKTRSALLLAATAAESKGVELSPKGLEYFAEAIDPEWEEKQDDGQNKKDKQKDNEEINAAVLQKKANEAEENNTLLSIMNKLPNKDGKRWIVNSFEFNQGEQDFRVSMRVLMNGDNAIFTALDITEPDNDNRYSFSLEFINNKVNKLGVFNLQDNQREKLAALFEIPEKNVFIKTGFENLAEAEYGENLLRFIDEAV